MTQHHFHLLLDDSPAPRNLLDRVDEITVEQEMDVAWEATVRMSIRADERGIWHGDHQRFSAPFARVRVEIAARGGASAALIDGPVVGYDALRSSSPGESTLTMIVRDDSAYLNREERYRFHQDLEDHEVARRLFQKASEHIPPSNLQIDTIDTDARSDDDLPPVVVWRGTAMQLLRKLAKRQGMHAYVLPGASVGRSIGCFKYPPTDASDLPALVLLGRERNVEKLTVTSNDERPADATATTLSITDRSLVTETVRVRDLELLGSTPRVEREEEGLGRRLVSPVSDSVGAQGRARAEARRASYAFEATGRVLADCYAGVLTPYRVVRVRAAGDRESGRFLIHRVTHTLTRSSYEQSFTLRRDALSEGSSSVINDLRGTTV